MATKKGIDVSKWQGVIDWSKVKAAGIEFAMLRCGYGKSIGQKDEQFERNYKNATAAGIPVGAYHYSYATTVEGAKAEANYCLSLLKGKKFEYPIAFDIEDKTQAHLSCADISAIIKAFCSIVEAAGYYVVIYANKSWLDNKIDDECKKKYDVWLAQWTDKPTFKGSFGLWQYSSKGKVNGISGDVDLNEAYKDYPEIIKKAGLNGFEKSTVNAAANTAAEKYKKGAAVKLDNTPVYISSTATKPATHKTGTYFLYDGEQINGKYRITSRKEYCGQTPASRYVTGWAELK